MSLRKALIAAVASLACTAGLVVAAGGATAAPATPSKPPAAAAQQSPGRIQVDEPLTRRERDQQALNTLGANVGTAVSIGGLIGTGIGAVAGCVIGGVIIPAVGCVPGVVTGAGFGGIVGTVVAGGPTLAVAVDQYFKTINSPFIPPKTITVPLSPAR